VVGWGVDGVASAETGPVVSLDIGRLNQVVHVDEGSGLARIQAGTRPRPRDPARRTRRTLVHRVPERRAILGCFFPIWSAGVAAMREFGIRRGAVRHGVSDGPETAFSFATRRRGTEASSSVPGRRPSAQKKFDTPCIRDFLVGRGALADLCETAAPWLQIPALYEHGGGG